MTIGLTDIPLLARGLAPWAEDYILNCCQACILNIHACSITITLAVLMHSDPMSRAHPMDAD